MKTAKHCIDWLLARVIVGIAGVAVAGAMFIVPAMLAELLCSFSAKVGRKISLSIDLNPSNL